MKEVAPKGQLPSIQDLYADVEWAAKQNDLNRLLNQEPKKEWIKEHPFNKGMKYIPIERIEWLLTNIFLHWWVEVKEVKVVANSVVVTITLSVIDPITGDTISQDGVAGVDIQTKRDAPATDFNQIIPFAVMKAVPAAKSYAIKDAAENFGKLFGKDLNRKDFIPYLNLDNKFDLDAISCNQDQIVELYALLKDARLDHDERDEIVERIKSGPSITEYHLLKSTLMESDFSVIDRVRNGDNMSQKELVVAVAKKMDDDE